METDYRDKLKYATDIVFCMDATMSMYPMLDEISSRAYRFTEDLTSAMGRRGKSMGSLRTRIITFRDYLSDRENAMLATDFYELPEMRYEFGAAIHSIVPQGGGDDPEDAYEALYYAIRSDWSTAPGRRRHVIVILSDADTHDLRFAAKAANYPTRMARDFSELTSLWGNRYTPGLMDQKAKRLVVFAPDVPGWSRIRTGGWDNVTHVFTQKDNGLRDKSYDEMIDIIANSI